MNIVRVADIKDKKLRVNAYSRIRRGAITPIFDELGYVCVDLNKLMKPVKIGRPIKRKGEK